MEPRVKLERARRPRIRRQSRRMSVEVLARLFHISTTDIRPPPNLPKSTPPDASAASSTSAGLGAGTGVGAAGGPCAAASGVVVATAVAAAAVAVAASGGNLGPLVAACAGADAGAGGQRSCTVASMEKGLEDQPRIAWKESGRGVANSEDGEAPTSRPRSSNGLAGSQAGNRRERGRTSSRSSIKDPRSGGPPGPGSGTPRNTTGDGGRPRLPRGGLGARATRADQLLSW